MDDLYRDYILEHYRRPHNFGPLESPSASFEGANPLCGDRITMQLTVEDGVVKDVGFTGRGCAISQASASLLTDEVKGKPVADVAAFGATDLLDLLGIEISPARLKCAMLSFESLQHLLDEVGAKPHRRHGVLTAPSPSPRRPWRPVVHRSPCSHAEDLPGAPPGGSQRDSRGQRGRGRRPPPVAAAPCCSTSARRASGTRAT